MIERPLLPYLSSAFSHIFLFTLSLLPCCCWDRPKAEGLSMSWLCQVPEWGWGSIVDPTISATIRVVYRIKGSISNLVGLTPLKRTWRMSWHSCQVALVVGRWWTIVVDPTAISASLSLLSLPPGVCYQLVFFSLNIDTTILYKIKDWVVDWFVYQPSDPSWLWVLQLPSGKSFFFATLLSHCPFSFSQSQSK